MSQTGIRTSPEILVLLLKCLTLVSYPYLTGLGRLFTFGKSKVRSILKTTYLKYLQINENRILLTFFVLMQSLWENRLL